MSSRIARSADSSRAGRANAAAAAMASKGKGKAAVMAKRNSVNTPSPSRRANGVSSGRHYATRRNPGTARSPIFLDGEKTDEDDSGDAQDQHDEDYLFNARAVQSERMTRSRNAAAVDSVLSAPQAKQSGKTATSVAPTAAPRRANQQKKKEVRKASVRKASYELDGSESDLSEIPDEDGEETSKPTSMIRSDARSNGEDDDKNSTISLDSTESDGEMAARLLEAGDGESLLGSAAASSAGDTDREEERYIIEEAERRTTKRAAQRFSSASSAVASTSAHPVDESGAQSDRSGSLSPHTLRQLGLDGLFDDADAYGSSSEPSFTDFFGSDSDGDMEQEIEVHLDPRSDDDQLTTDDGDDSDNDSSMSDISDLDADLLSVPFVNSVGETLAAGAGTQVTPGAEMPVQADIPLLVIEDLDGRLIYARAQDGEAVFGSDGEFECVDDSDAEDTDEEDDLGGWHRGRTWPSWRAQRMDEDETDSGDTTDELPNEDMPFPRLLVGSVAPHGGRGARRARALAARHRRLSPATARGRSPPSAREASGSEQLQVTGKARKGANELRDVDITISTADLARDPQATLEAAAKSLGLSTEEVARMVAGIDDPTAESHGSPSKPQLPPAVGKPSADPVAPKTKPPMGSFMPTSSKSVHRAVIDGSRQAPSPFVHRYGTQKRGLATRKRQPTLTTPSSKRMRRLSIDDAMGSQHASSVTDAASESGASAADGRSHTPSPGEASTGRGEEENFIMDLDEVMDASLMWRGGMSSSPPKEGERTPKGTSPTPDARQRQNSIGTGKETAAGLNMSAVARWHRIPMAAFREGQVTSSSSSHPLGMYLFTRARNGPGGRSQSHRSDDRHAEHSPFRGRGQGNEVHLGAVPSITSRDAFIVSPVLWPVRGRNDGGNDGERAASSTQNAMEARRLPSSGKGKSQGTARAVATGNVRKTMTRREKRERKARKDIIKAALRESGIDVDADGMSKNGAHADERATNGLASPSAGMPRLSITDSTPLGSPAIKGATETKSFSNSSHQAKSAPVDIPSATRAPTQQISGTNFQAPSPALMALSSSPVAIPLPSHAPGLGIHHGQSSIEATGTVSSSLPLSMSPSSASSGSFQQPPSSVFGMPLTSPLFSGLLNPPNLGFRDDLDEREEEGVLTI